MNVELLPVAGALASLGALSISVYYTFRHGSDKRGSKYILDNSSIRNHAIDGAMANEALFRLSTHIKSLNPDFIVGVNRGGVMVGAYVALLLGIKSRNFVKCLVSRKGKYKATCHVGHMHGTVVVIDDVSRSGKTIEEATRVIKNKNPQIEDIYSAVLVTTLDNRKHPIFEDLDYYSFATFDNEINLPWTPKLKGLPDREKVRLKLFREIRKKPMNKMAKDIASHLYEPD